MPWAAAGPWVAAAGAVAGSLISSSASRKAADTQADSANAANAISQAQYAQNRTDAAPWRAAGETALGQMSAGTANGGDLNRDFTLADFQQDPGYQFRMSQGSNALQASAAARGGLLSGGTLKALDRYGQDYASGEYTNAYNRFNSDRTQRFNRLASLAGTGQTATRDVAAQGTALASQIGNNTMQGANARASGYVGQANAANQGLTTLGNLWQYQQRPQSMPAPSAGPNWAANPGFGTGVGYGEQDLGQYIGG